MTKINKEGWEIKKLGEVCSIYGRIGFRGYKRTDYVDSIEEGAISLSPSNITDNKLFYDKCTFITWQKYEESPEIKIFNDDILFVKTASVGKCAIVKNLPHEATINPQFVVLKDVRCENKFLFYHLLAPTFQTAVQKITMGSSVPTLSQKALALLSINLPPLPIQQRIVEELDEINAIISAKKQQLSKLDELAQSIFYNMFGDPVANEKGWEVKTLGECCSQINDGTHFSPKNTETGDFMYVTAKNIKKEGIVLDNITYIDEETHKAIYARCNPEYGDVLYIKDGATTGIATINTLKEEFSLLSSVALIKTGNKIVNHYLKAVLNFATMYNSIRTNMGGAAITRLTLQKINAIRIPLPPLPLQETFAARVAAIEEEKATIAASIEKMQTLLDARMQEYFG